MLERCVVIGHDRKGRLCAVLAVPLDPAVSLWLAQLRLIFDAIYLADPDTVAAKLESHESAFSAVANAVGIDQASELNIGGGEELSLMSIHGEASPAVRLINSTVF